MTGIEEGGLPRRFAPRNDEGCGVFAMTKCVGFWELTETEDLFLILLENLHKQGMT